MVAIFLPPLWLALLPVIVIESALLARSLNLRVGRILVGAAIGNVASTIAGIPMLWLLAASLQLAYAGEARGLSSVSDRVYAVTVQAPWLIPYETELKWMIPLALLVLAVPAYCASVVIEWLCLLPFARPAKLGASVRAVAFANLCSYALLAVLFAAVLLAGEHLRSIFKLFEPTTMTLAESVFSLAQSFSGSPN